MYFQQLGEANFGKSMYRPPQQETRYGFDLYTRPGIFPRDEVGFVQCSAHASFAWIQFLKQGPAYKKEGPDPNKGSNQQ